MIGAYQSTIVLQCCATTTIGGIDYRAQWAHHVGAQVGCVLTARPTMAPSAVDAGLVKVLYPITTEAVPPAVEVAFLARWAGTQRWIL